MYTYKYPRAALTTDAIIYVKENDETYVLLIERAQAPFEYKWALPGGFIEMDETLEKACIRELNEETGLVVNEMKQFKTYDAIGRDPRHRTLSVVYYANLDGRLPVKGGDDASKANWFPVSQLPDLAFDHEKILDDFFRTIG